MSLNVKLDFPAALEEKLRDEVKNLDVKVKEAFALQLFREGRISHFELSQALGLDRFETDGYLKRHNVYDGSLTAEDIEHDRRVLAELMAKGK